MHRVCTGALGFTAWNAFNEALWRELTTEAQVRARRGLLETSSRFFGSDIDRRVIEMARANARRAGVAELITFNANDISKLVNPLPEGPVGTVISNPLRRTVGKRACIDCIA